MIILVDMDGALADFELGIVNGWQKRFPHIPFVPLSERKSFYVRLDYPEELRSRVDDIINSPGFFLNLEPISHGLQAVREMQNAGHTVVICTAPITRFENCVPEKYHWIANNLGREYTRQIIMTKDKTLVRGEVLVDDRPEIDGACKPTWEHVVFDAPYNRQIKHKRRLTDWRNWREVIDSTTST